VQHCRQLIHKYEIKREQKVINNNNAGCFFRFVNRKLSCKSGLGALINDDGDIVTSDIDRANLLNDYFASMCTTDDGSKPAFDRVVEDDCNLDSIDFTPGRIYSVIRKLKASGAAGPDGFPPLLFKNLAGSLAEPLSLMFSSFMSIGQVPQEWKHAFVTPVYKSGSPSSVANYRPISLTCVACKLMENIVVANVFSYLRKRT